MPYAPPTFHHHSFTHRNRALQIFCEKQPLTNIHHLLQTIFLRFIYSAKVEHACNFLLCTSSFIQMDHLETSFTSIVPLSKLHKSRTEKHALLVGHIHLCTHMFPVTLGIWTSDPSVASLLVKPLGFCYHYYWSNVYYQNVSVINIRLPKYTNINHVLWMLYKYTFCAVCSFLLFFIALTTYCKYHLNSTVPFACYFFKSLDKKRYVLHAS